MKKKIIGGIAIMAIAAVAAFNVNFGAQNDSLSAMGLANVEALASGESGSRYGWYDWMRDCCGTGGNYQCYYDCD